MTKLLHLIAALSLVAYEDEQPPAETPPAETPPAEEAPTTFSKADVDRLLGEERRRSQEVHRKTLAELEAVRPKLNMTKQERDDLDVRMKDLQKELLTKEEIASQEQARLRKAHENKVAELSGEKDMWQQRYTSSYIDRSITDAAVEFDAYNPSQVVSLLRQDTRLVPKLDAEGNPTDQFEPKIQFEDTDKEGKPVTLELTPKETLKRMREKDAFLNLFRGTGVGGLGGNNQGADKKRDVRDLAKDPEAYRKARASGELTF